MTIHHEVITQKETLSAREGRRRGVRVTARALDEIERAWERAQLRIEALVAAAEHDDDPAVVAAASRLRRSLLRGAPDAKRAPAKKVSYARVQLCLARQRPLSFDASLAGLDDALAALHEATEALALRAGSDSPAARRPGPVTALSLRLARPTNDNSAGA